MRWKNCVILALLTIVLPCGCAQQPRLAPRPGVYTAEPAPLRDTPTTSDRGTLFVDPNPDEPASD